MKRASIVFLDRDGTIIRDVHFVSRPEDVEVLPGAAEAIARLNEASIPVVVVTNQSGIGRGYYDAEDYERVHERMVELLLERGARIDGAYYCPHAPDRAPPCDCRKPRPRLFEQALADFRANPAAAFYVGDRLRDVAPAATLGGTGILVLGPETIPDELDEAQVLARTVQSLGEAVDIALGVTTDTLAE